MALADRIVLIDGGAVALDMAVDLPRPRRRSGAALESAILDRLLDTSARPAS